MIATCGYGHCYQDNKFGYRIDLPKGWKQEKTSVTGIVGITATSSNNAQISVGATAQNIDNFESTDYFARQFTKKVTLNMFRAACNELELLNASALTFKGHKAITNLVKCDNQVVSNIYVVKGGYMYSMTGVFYEWDRASAQIIKESIATYRFTK